MTMTFFERMNKQFELNYYVFRTILLAPLNLKFEITTLI